MDAVAALVAALAGAVVFHRALQYFFVQDDFAALGRAAGLLPRFDEPWRWLSLQFFFDVMRPLAGLDPVPYHVASLIGHGLAAALVFAFARRFVHPVAALVGACFFATHPSSFTAVYWVSTIGDLYALVFALAALLLGLRTDRWRLAAPAAFVLALLCKESILLLPLLLPVIRMLDPRHGRPSPRAAWLDPVFLTMLVTSAAYLAYFAWQNAPVADPSLEAEPYAVGVGSHVWRNLLTYAGWTVNVAVPFVAGFTDAIDPPVYPWGIAWLVILAAGSAVPALRRRAWHLGAIVFIVLLLPVLPLENHTYHYYLYACLLGAATCIAALADWALGSAAVTGRAGGAVAWATAVALAVALTANGYALVHKIETMPFTLPGTRAEPLIDRALIARRVITGIRSAGIPPGTTLHMGSPEAQALAVRNAPGTFGPDRETYWERNVRSALYGGLAIRLYEPHVDSVRFIRTMVPGDASRIRYAMYRVTGQTDVLTPAAMDSVVEAARAQAE